MKMKLVATAFAALLTCTAANAQVTVRIGPPPRRVEVVPVRPVGHPDWVWQPGFHRWDGRAYVWVPGHYVAPPRPRAVWVPGRWERRGRGYVWIEGRWR